MLKKPSKVSRPKLQEFQSCHQSMRLRNLNLVELLFLKMDDMLLLLAMGHLQVNPPKMGLAVVFFSILDLQNLEVVSRVTGVGNEAYFTALFLMI